MKICPQCQTENVDGAWKCKSCGAELPSRGQDSLGQDVAAVSNTTSKRIETTGVQVLTEVARKCRQEMLTGDVPERAIREELKYHGRNVLIGVLSLLVGLFFALALPAVDIGKSFFEIIAGIGLTLGTVLIVRALLSGVVNLIRGPKNDSVADVLNALYLEGLGGGNVGAVWSSLAPCAREEFGDVQVFRRYLESLENRLKPFVNETLELTECKPADKLAFSIVDLKEEGQGEDGIFQVAFDLKVSYMVEQYDKDMMIEIVPLGSVLLPQRKTVIEANGKYYLASGRVDLPEGLQAD